MTTTEGRLLFCGLSLTALVLVALGVMWAVAPDRAHVYAAMIGLNLFIGRAAGMTFGYASGLAHGQVVPLNMLIETIHVLVVYSLFVLSWRRMLALPALLPYLMRVHEAAAARDGVVQRFGVIGLFAFVFVPFWMTGPVVGSIIGFLIGLRPWVTMTVVLLSTYVAIGVWALLLNELVAWAATVNRFAPWALIAAIVLITAAIHLRAGLWGRPSSRDGARS